MSALARGVSWSHQRQADDLRGVDGVRASRRTPCPTKSAGPRGNPAGRSGGGRAGQEATRESCCAPHAHPEAGTEALDLGVTVADNAHDMSHELQEVISATLEAFVSFQEERGVKLSSAIVLLALEMEASRVRRHCRGMGVTNDEIKEIQRAASSCARSLYEKELLDPVDNTSN